MLNVESLLPKVEFSRESLDVEIGLPQGVPSVSEMRSAGFDAHPFAAGVTVYVKYPVALTDLREWCIESLNSRVRTRIIDALGLHGVRVDVVAAEAAGPSAGFRLPAVLIPAWNVQQLRCGVDEGMLRMKVYFPLGLPDVNCGISQTLVVQLSRGIAELPSGWVDHGLFEQKVQEKLCNGVRRMELDRNCSNMEPFAMIVSAGLRLSRDQWQFDNYVTEAERSCNATRDPQEQYTLRQEVQRLQTIRRTLGTPAMPSNAWESTPAARPLEVRVRDSKKGTNLAWFGATETLAVLDNDFKLLKTFPAANNVASGSSIWPKDRYPFSWHSLHNDPEIKGPHGLPENHPDGPYGQNGNFIFEKVPGRTEMGVHSGRRHFLHPITHEVMGIHYYTR